MVFRKFLSENHNKPLIFREIRDIMGERGDAFMKRKPDTNSRFGERLRGLRSERGLSMEQLCEQFNKTQTTIRLNRSTIYRYEKGQQEPMLSTVAAIASFLGVSPVYLMGDSDDRHCEASHISNSAVVQGNNATTLIVRNGGVHERELSDDEAELLKIFAMLSPRGRHALMSAAFELEEKENKTEG